MREYAAREIAIHSPSVENLPTPPPRLVRQAPARSPLAREPRSLSHLGSGGYAAADAHRRRPTVLPAIPPPISSRRIPRPGRAGGSAQTLVRPRLLQPRAKSPPRGTRNRRPPWSGIPERARG